MVGGVTAARADTAVGPRLRRAGYGRFDVADDLCRRFLRRVRNARIATRRRRFDGADPAVRGRRRSHVENVPDPGRRGHPPGGVSRWQPRPVSARRRRPSAVVRRNVDSRRSDPRTRHRPTDGPSLDLPVRSMDRVPQPFRPVERARFCAVRGCSIGVGDRSPFVGDRRGRHHDHDHRPRPRHRRPPPPRRRLPHRPPPRPPTSPACRRCRRRRSSLPSSSRASRRREAHSPGWCSHRPRVRRRRPRHRGRSTRASDSTPTRLRRRSSSSRPSSAQVDARRR